MTEEELDRKIEEQLSRGRLSGLEGGENEESRKPKEDRNATDLTSCEESETKVAIPIKTHQKTAALEDPREGTGTMVDVAVNTDECAPQNAFPQPSTYEMSAQPFHQSPPRKLCIAPTSQVHATFAWVDQSLKEDSSAIEAALRMRRCHSSPAVRPIGGELSLEKRVPPWGPFHPRKSPGTAASREGPKEAARTELRRQQREQRRLQAEQKQQEERTRKELLRDMKRHRLLQRSLQGSQKQQESSERTCQRLGRLRVAREERMRQESCLLEEEKIKEGQRLEFLKAQRRQRDQQLMEHNQRVDAQEDKRLELLKSRTQSVQRNWKAAGQEQDPEEEKVAAKRRDFQKRALISQQVEKKRQETEDLQRYLKEQSLLMLRASLLS
ncbi:uncharacterized protein LOC143838491 [Paroedura picta]|uniref:uncharacterized protein LOC143838491 n=1 Tax=Paroedura picta TaxID=143630 RepID=UPI004055E18F